MPFSINPFQKFVRYLEISRILLRYGLGEYVKTFHPAFLLAHLGLGKKKVFIRSLPERLRLVLEELGPTFIKIGQFASTRSDILPEEFTRELSKLQDEVKPGAFGEIKRIIEKEVGPIDSIFDEFNEEPIGSASIAQVYKARYKGNQVIVKVRRPGIERVIETDISILKMLARIVESNIPAFYGRRLDKIVDTFARTIREELDFLNEINNVERFRVFFQNDPRVYIPQVYREISTNKVLIQEHIAGIKISDIKTMKKNGIDPKVVAQNGADIFLKQVLIGGIFHADPHPGNIFVKENNVIVPVDFGMVGRLTPKMKDEILNILIGVTEREPERIARALLRTGIVEDGIDFDSLREDILYILNKFEGKNLHQISVTEFASDINRVIRNYHIRIPQELLYFSKALSQIESIGKELNPDFDTIKWLKGFMVRHNLGVFSIRERLRRGKWWIKDMFSVLLDLPENINRLFEISQSINQIKRVEENKDKRIYWLLSGFGIMLLSIFTFNVSAHPILKILSSLGILFSFLIFVGQILFAIWSR
ncbi:MAG: AarF/ABC1/UbiB kinase family protein [candidate division WOR-3 bacterium]